VYTPVDAFFAGYKLKRRFSDIKFIPYFLDSLSGGYGPQYFSKKQIIKRGLKIENRVFPFADKIILMKSSEEHHLKYNSKYKEKFCFLDIPMLKQQNIVEKTQKDETVKLLFVGSIAAKVRNPDTLINALKGLKKQNVNCEFVGNIDCKDRFSELVTLFGDRLVFTDFINHDELTKKFCEADFLINIGNAVSTMVPSKIFEYMSYGKPIISTFDIADEPSKKYLEKYPLALLLSGENSPEENAREIDIFISNNLGKTVEFEELEKDFFLNTPQAFIAEV
jgi:glycosyltransferase involved in cell wall biosynthesis